MLPHPSVALAKGWLRAHTDPGDHNLFNFHVGRNEMKSDISRRNSGVGRLFVSRGGRLID